MYSLFMIYLVNTLPKHVQLINLSLFYHFITFINPEDLSY